MIKRSISRLNVIGVVYNALKEHFVTIEKAEFNRLTGEYNFKTDWAEVSLTIFIALALSVTLSWYFGFPKDIAELHTTFLSLTCGLSLNALILTLDKLRNSNTKTADTLTAKEKALFNSSKGFICSAALSASCIILSFFLAFKSDGVKKLSSTEWQEFGVWDIMTILYYFLLWLLLQSLVLTIRRFYNSFNE